MEKFALLNLLKALDGLSGKTDAGAGGAADGNFAKNSGKNGGSGENGGFGEPAADGGNLNGFGGAGLGRLGGILGNLLKGGLFNGSPQGGQNNAGQNTGNGFNSTDGSGSFGGNGGNGGYADATQNNVMAGVLERHEAMANRVRNKK